MEPRASGLRGDILVAGTLAAVLGVGWTVRDWLALQYLRLPDTDDVMRLQQVRDWLGGQSWSDLAQHRLGAGVPMHWSRLADLGPAALIETLAPLAGRHGAEVAAVIAWPLLLFATALLLVARVSRAAGGENVGRTAVVIAAIAYPATTVFLPGRIDHHGLQVVLLLGAMLATLVSAGWRRGAALGVLTAASLVVGLETAPLLLALWLVAAAEWLLDYAGAGARLVGLGAGALAGLVVARLAFASDAFFFPACDGFTVDAWRAALVGSGGILLLGLAGRLLAIRLRPGAALLVGLGVAVTASSVAPRCLHPYGAVDPLLARTWLANVGEAQSLIAAPTATAIGYAGVMVAGLVATAALLVRTRRRGWAVLLAVQVAALLVTAVQLRGAYAGAMLAAPALAALVTAARRRGALPLAGAWLASAGMLYPLAAEAVTRTSHATANAAAGCGDPHVIARLAILPTGRVFAPIDMGAWGIAATRLAFVAGPYHRNNGGNLAVLRFFTGPAGSVQMIATAWHTRYVLLCDGDLATPGAGPASLARSLTSDRAPDWLVRMPAPAGVHLYAIRQNSSPDYDTMR